MRKILLFCLLCLSLPFMALADSPLTSTDFTPGYPKSKNVLLAKQSGGKISPKLLKFLSGKGAIGEKIAVINALGWGENAMNNALEIQQALGAKSPSAEQYCLLAYAYALGNYFEVSKALEYSNAAIAMGSKSYTVHLVNALIRAQVYMDDGNTWCQVYRVCDDVRMNKDLVKDLPEASIASVFSYIELYKDNC